MKSEMAVPALGPVDSRLGEVAGGSRAAAMTEHGPLLGPDYAK